MELLKFVIFLHIYYIYLLVADHLSDVEYILCKNCGNEIFSVKSLMVKKSPYAIRTWNDTLFHNSFFSQSNIVNQTLKNTSAEYSYVEDSDPNIYTTIQLLKNPHGNTFELITTRKAYLLLLNHTTSIQDTWFPNFRWTVGVCPHCFNHLGWYFESILGEDGFFALILDQLISHNYADTLVITPKLKMF